MALAVLAGCVPLGGPQVAPAPMQPGPIVVLAVTNRSPESRVVEFEHEAEGSSGGGGGEVPCGRMVMELGAVTGTYRLSVDGDEIASGRVPPGAGATSYLVFEVVIDEDGISRVAGPAIAQRAPQVEPTVCP